MKPGLAAGLLAREESVMAELIAATFEPLALGEAGDTITVSGTTFRFGFSKRNGLITSVRILGQEWLAGGGPLPDLWVSPEVDPRAGRWDCLLYTSDAADE